MSELKRTVQQGTGFQSGRADPGTTEQETEANREAEFGTAERGTRGTDRDSDSSGESKNQGHGHPRRDRESNQE